VCGGLNFNLFGHIYNNGHRKADLKRREANFEMSTSAPKFKIRYGLIKFMYVFTIIVAGGVGILYLASPSTWLAIFAFPFEEPLMAGIAASAYVAFAVLSIFGLRSPLKFVPILLLQFTYKAVWFIAVIFPLLFSGQFPPYGMIMSGIFVLFVIGDMIAIPWSYLFAK